jgi:hypothetical protein
VQREENPAGVPSNNNNVNDEPMSSDEVFQFPIQFMDGLVDISRHLTTVPSDQYKTELHKQLEKQDAYLHGLPKTGGGAFHTQQSGLLCFRKRFLLFS